MSDKRGPWQTDGRLLGSDFRQPAATFVFILLLIVVTMAGDRWARADMRPAANGPILAVEVVGPISVAAADHVCKTLQQAGILQAEAVILQVDTPGGLLTATRSMVQCILASPSPVVVYVAPSGARAASAGVYIAMAAHMAAMAPGTHIGAATPVAIGIPGPGQPTDRQPDGRDRREGSGSQQRASELKALNDAVGYLKSLAQLRGRNAEWAEQAVRDAATLTASEALQRGVIEFVADDRADLLRKLDGRATKISGISRQVRTEGVRVQDVTPNWRHRLLSVIADPNIALILLMVGIYGLLFEFWSPGALVPGVLGGISLLLALVALSALPVSYGALALLLLGVALMTAEAFSPGIGVLGIGGLAAFVTGAIFLFDAEHMDFELRLAWPVIVATALVSAALSLGVLAAALKARQRPPFTGSEEMIGLIGSVVSWGGDEGIVRVHGETWRAKSVAPCQPGSAVRVRARDNLILYVDPA